MTTIQGVINGLLHALNQSLPFGDLSLLLDLQKKFPLGTPSPATWVMLWGAILLAYIVICRHDLASQFFSLTGALIQRKMPMTMDERLPINIIVTNIPIFLALAYGREGIYSWTGEPEIGIHPYILYGIFGAAGLAMVAADYFSRKTKELYDWTLVDSAFLGIIGATCWLPGMGILTASVSGALLLNHNRESAARMAVMVSTPLVTYEFIRAWNIFSHSGSPWQEGDISWITLGLTFIVTFITSVAALSSLLHTFSSKGPKGYAYGRIASAILLLGWLFYQNQI